MALTTSQAAKRCGIARQTLIEWIQRGVIPAPPVRVSARGHSVRLFGPRDIAIIENYKRRNFRKGRGRKKAKR